MKIEVARIKRAAEPVEHLLVFFVLRIFDSLQKFVVAPDAARVFRRTSVLSIQANRILLFRVWKYFLGRPGMSTSDTETLR